MKLRTLIIQSIIIALTLALYGCQDAPPNDYIEQNYVESYLIVEQPIRYVKVMRTLSVTDSFNYEKSFIRDAQVLIKMGNKSFPLVCNQSGTDGYYFPDTTYLVEPNKKYDLEITLKDGTVMTGSTMTPARFDWTEPVADVIYYPKDTLNLTDGTKDTIRWQSNPNVKFYYLIRVKSLDTLEYGKYLSPATNEKNRRIYTSFRGGKDSPEYRETTRWGMVPLPETPIVWSAFKWFGKNELSIFVADKNFMIWTLQYFRTNQYNSVLGNIKNGIGSFGSASMISKTTFLMKNQP